MDVAQTASFLQSMTYETGILDYEDFPITADPVWLLGCEYNGSEELDQLKRDFCSRFWFTYRRGYAPIGGTGPTTDTGWGCMLRCGQMMLAQALANRHLGRAWRWIPGKYNPKSFEILRLFLDNKGSTYSIHQIASMGASEGKAVGEWFGPNTIAQVLKKLAIYDDWSKISIHVALDNTVIEDDLRYLCTGSCEKKVSPPASPKSRTSTLESNDSCTVNAFPNSPSVLNNDQPPRNKPSKKSCDIMSSSLGSVNGHARNKESKKKSKKRQKNSKMCNSCGSLSTSSGSGLDSSNHDSLSSNHDSLSSNHESTTSNHESTTSNHESTSSADFRPLLLIIPLRLGLSEINPVYASSLKKCLMFPQSVGIIGGKPNHAHYFIGYVGDQLLYLDPHTTQYYADVTEPQQTDDSYHCDYISRMKITSIDPSIALGFYCGSESALDDLCQRVRTEIIQSERTPMFELHKHRPRHWPPFEPYSPEGAGGLDNFTVVEEADRHYDTDEEFELL